MDGCAMRIQKDYKEAMAGDSIIIEMSGNLPSIHTQSRS